MGTSTMLKKNYRTNSGYFTSSFDIQRMLIVPLNGFDGPFFYVKSMDDGQYEVSGEGYICDTGWKAAMDGQRETIADAKKKLESIGRLGFYHLGSNGNVTRQEWFEYNDGKVGKPSRWILTDDDFFQCRKTIKPNHAYHSGNLVLDGEYELVQVNAHAIGDREEKIHHVAHGIVKVSDYTEKQLCGYLGYFGYKDIDSFIQSNNGDFKCELIAEMIFETDCLDYELHSNPVDFKEACKTIKGITGLSIKN